MSPCLSLYRKSQISCCPRGRPSCTQHIPASEEARSGFRLTFTTEPLLSRNNQVSLVIALVVLFIFILVGCSSGAMEDGRGRPMTISDELPAIIFCFKNKFHFPPTYHQPTKKNHVVDSALYVFLHSHQPHLQLTTLWIHKILFLRWVQWFKRRLVKSIACVRQLWFFAYLRSSTHHDMIVDEDQYWSIHSVFMMIKASYWYIASFHGRKYRHR